MTRVSRLPAVHGYVEHEVCTPEARDCWPPSRTTFWSPRTSTISPTSRARFSRRRALTTHVHTGATVC